MDSDQANVKLLPRNLLICLLTVATASANAGPHHLGPPPWRHHHHHRGGGPDVGTLILGLAVAVPLIALAQKADRPAPEIAYVTPPPPPPPLPPLVQFSPASRPVPVVYPRLGQSQGQQEEDSRDCNRWATTQPAAMADTNIFYRAVEACMDGRGYTVR